MSCTAPCHIGGLSPNQYLSLMSPSRDTPHQRGRKVQWIRYQLATVPLFFHRLTHWLLHGRTWNNDRALFNRFQNNVTDITQSGSYKTSEINKIAECLISRNPDLDAAAITQALDHPGQTRHEMLKNAEEAERQIRGPQIGKTPTMTWEKKFELLYPTLDPKVLKQNQDEETTDLVKQRRKEIASLQKYYTTSIYRNPNRGNEIQRLLDKRKWTLEPTTRGTGGTYFAKKKCHTKYVIKPLDEGAKTLNNRKFIRDENGDPIPLSSLSTSVADRVRASIPPYTEPLAERLASLVSQRFFGKKGPVPPTILAILKSDTFYDRAEDPNDLKPKEKLCSVQKFISAHGPVNDCTEHQKACIKSDSVADNLLLSIILGDTDRHADNMILTLDDEIGAIDSGLCFPANNSELRFYTVCLDQAKAPFLDKHQTIIQKLCDRDNEEMTEFFNKIKQAHLAHAQACNPNPIACVQRIQARYANNVVKAMKARLAMAKWGIEKNMSMREIGIRVIALHNKAYAYRDDEMTLNDVPPFQIGLDGDQTWDDFLGSKQPAQKEDTDKEKSCQLNTGTFQRNP